MNKTAAVIAGVIGVGLILAISVGSNSCGFENTDHRIHREAKEETRRIMDDAERETKDLMQRFGQ